MAAPDSDAVAVAQNLIEERVRSHVSDMGALVGKLVKNSHSREDLQKAARTFASYEGFVRNTKHHFGAILSEIEATSNDMEVIKRELYETLPPAKR